MTVSRRDLIVSSGAAMLAAACSKLPRPTDGAGKATAAIPPEATRLLDSMTDALLAEFPENATFRGVDKGAREILRHRFSDRSDAGRAARTDAAKGRLAQLKALDRSQLDPAALVGLDSAIDAHGLALAGAAFPYGDVNVLSGLNSYITNPYAVTQLSGSFVMVPDFLSSLHVTNSAAAAEAYLDRVGAYEKGLDQETARLASDAAHGVIAPSFVIANIAGQIARALKQPVADWGLVTTIVNRAKERNIAGDWNARITQLATDRIKPALGRQLDALKALETKATTDAGAWKLPRGDEWYGWALKTGTTTDRTAEEVHAIGLEQVKEIEARMNELLAAQGLTKGTAGERVATMSADRKFLFPNTDQGRTELIAYCNGRVAVMRARLPELFRTSPKSELIIKRVPPDIEAGASGGYAIDGSLDGTRPASYYINLRDTGNWPRFLLPTLTYHEGLPGHVWQGAYAHRPTALSIAPPVQRIHRGLGALRRTDRR